MRWLLAASLALTACSAGDEATPTSTSDTSPTSTAVTTSTPTSEPATTTSDPGSTTPPTSSSPPATPLDADLVLHGGTVLTLDAESTVATGLALRAGRIVAVGDGDDLLARAPDSLAIDLDGRTVIPGIVDTHIHVVQNQTPDVEAMLAEERMLVESGRTTLGVPAIIPLNLEGYLQLRDSGRALLRNHLYLSVNAVCGELVESEGWWRDFEFDRSPEHRVAIAGIKLFSDGGACNAPAASLTWSDGTDGALYVDAERVAEVVRQADEVGALALVHAIGDRALDVVLDGFEDAAIGDNPNRHRIDHNTLVRDDQVERYGTVGVNFVGWGWFDSCLEQTGNGWSSLGTDHLGWLRRHAEVGAANPGIRVAWHSDAPFSPTDIFEQLLSLTEMTSLDEDGTPCPAPEWMSDRIVPAETALRMMTIDAAAAMDLDGDLGSLEVGKIADLAVLRNDPTARTGLDLLDNRVDATWIDGRVAWCDGWTACDIAPGIADGVAPAPAEGLTMSASASRSGHGPELAIDGDASAESFWSSGAAAPGWIQVDFDEPRTVGGLRFTVFQNPPSETVHLLQLRVDGDLVEVARFEGFTATGDVLTWTPDAPVDGIDGLRMTTLSSESWPEWYEIEIVEQ